MIRGLPTNSTRGAQLLEAHAGGLDGAGEVLADAPEVLPRQGAKLGRRLLLAEAHRQVAQRHAPVPRDPASRPARRRSRPSRATQVSGSAWSKATSARARQ